MFTLSTERDIAINASKAALGFEVTLTPLAWQEIINAARAWDQNRQCANVMGRPIPVEMGDARIYFQEQPDGSLRISPWPPQTL